MSNLKEWILRAAEGEPIEAIVIGGVKRLDPIPEDLPWKKQDRSKWNRVLPWQDAEPLIDYDFDSSYGIPGCQAVTAWTKSRIIFISEYNGATSVECTPRHPVDHEPVMPGGW
jgi:hypothetical protein